MRAVELAVCLLFLPLVLPILVFCALAIALDSPGPILSRDERTAPNGRRFRMLRFRTVVHNHGYLNEVLAELSVLPPPDFKLPDDPRVTRVGSFLRRTSLHELPQIINVLRGEMSLVDWWTSASRMNHWAPHEPRSNGHR
jgi:lipopolysaccharide/colanic/teichoic acid biosynthesis glycosyltransferase